MKHNRLYAAMLMAVIAGPLSGCALKSAGGLAHFRSQKVEAQFDIARLAESENQLEKARKMYESIHRQDPSNAIVCHRLGIVYARETNYAAARRYFHEAHRLNPGDAEILSDMGYACYLNNDFAGAEAALSDALKINSQHARATNNLALVMGSQGRFDESYKLFRQVNKESEAHANVAYLYAQHGEGKQALEHYNRALTLDPEMKSAANAMVEISQLEQRMVADRGQKLPVQAATQPTPAAAPSTAAEAATPIPQLQALIFEGTQPPSSRPAAASAPAKTSPAATPIAESPPTAAPSVIEAAAVEVVKPASKVPAALEVATSAEPIEFATPAVAAKPVEVAAVEFAEATSVSPAIQLTAQSQEQVVTNSVVVENQQLTPLITPSIRPSTTRTQSLANVTDFVAPRVIMASDYLRLCPDATDAVKALLVTMNSQDPEQMKSALHKLGELGGSAASALPAVRFTLTHPSPDIRIHSALAVWRIEQNSHDAFPVLIEGLRNSDAKVRSFAATALEIGPRDDSLVTPLSGALSDSSPYVRLHAAEALCRYPQQQAAASTVILSHLTDKEANVRWLAAFILGEILPKSELTVQALTTSLKDSDHRVRAVAAFALGGLGNLATPAVNELKKLTAESQPEVRKAAQDAIRDIELSSTQAAAE